LAASGALGLVRARSASETAASASMAAAFGDRFGLGTYCAKADPWPSAASIVSQANA
jgi:hypothetical protein